MCVNNALEQRHIWPIIREGDNLELPSPSKKYVSTYSMSFCLLLYIFYIFYIRIYIHTHILYDCTYISITTVIVVRD